MMFQISNCLTNGLVAGALASAALLTVPAAEAASESVVYSFQGTDDGYQPSAGLNIRGTLFGTTEFGGRYGDGTVFSLNLTTNTEKVIDAFHRHEARPQYGAVPEAGLIAVKGTLYGTTAYGGMNLACDGGFFSGCGTVFALDLKTHKRTVLYSFQGGSDGEVPLAGLINVGGTLYGTTEYGGTCAANFGPGCGTVFSVNPATGAETVVHAFQFNGTDGIWPYAELNNVGGTLYGTTYQGGTGFCTQENIIVGCGTVFSINPSTGAEEVVYSFQNNITDGANPVAGLIDISGILYGTTQRGGANGSGTVFEINPTTGAETVVYSFCSQAACTDGDEPSAGLIRGFGGILYGTTAGGGAGTYRQGGTVFKVDPTTGAEKVLYSFCSQKSGQAICTDGESPVAGLIDVNGALYGTTAYGGALCGGDPDLGCGTVFKVTLP